MVLDYQSCLHGNFFRKSEHGNQTDRCRIQSCGHTKLGNHTPKRDLGSLCKNEKIHEVVKKSCKHDNQEKPVAPQCHRCFIFVVEISCKKSAESFCQCGKPEKISRKQIHAETDPKPPDGPAQLPFCKCKVNDPDDKNIGCNSFKGKKRCGFCLKDYKEQ